MSTVSQQTHATQETHDDRPPADPPFQFALRTLLLYVGAVCVLLAMAVRLGTVWGTVLVWAVMLVAAHVFGNSWSTRVGRPQKLDEPSAAPLTGSTIVYAPTTRLHTQHRLGWSMWIATITGAVIGGTFGTIVLTLAYWGTVGYEAIALGGVSSAIVGGFLGFLSSSFVNVASRAMREASSERRR